MLVYLVLGYLVFCLWVLSVGVLCFGGFGGGELWVKVNLRGWYNILIFGFWVFVVGLGVVFGFGCVESNGFSSDLFVGCLLFDSSVNLVGGLGLVLGGLSLVWVCIFGFDLAFGGLVAWVC